METEKGIKLSIQVDADSLRDRLKDYQLGTLTGVRPLLKDGDHTGWLVAGTLGYMETTLTGFVYVVGTWTPIEVLKVGP